MSNIMSELFRLEPGNEISPELAEFGRRAVVEIVKALAEQEAPRRPPEEVIELDTIA